MNSVLEEMPYRAHSKSYTNKGFGAQYDYGEIPTIHSLETNLVQVAFQSSYESLKSSLQKDFNDKLASERKENESLMVNLILKALDEINCDIQELNTQLTRTIGSIESKP